MSRRTRGCPDCEEGRQLFDIIVSWGETVNILSYAEEQLQHQEKILKDAYMYYLTQQHRSGSGSNAGTCLKCSKLDCRSSSPPLHHSIQEIRGALRDYGASGYSPGGHGKAFFAATPTAESRLTQQSKENRATPNTTETFQTPAPMRQTGVRETFQDTTPYGMKDNVLSGAGLRLNPETPQPNARRVSDLNARPSDDDNGLREFELALGLSGGNNREGSDRSEKYAGRFTPDSRAEPKRTSSWALGSDQRRGSDEVEHLGRKRDSGEAAMSTMTFPSRVGSAATRDAVPSSTSTTQRPARENTPPIRANPGDRESPQIAQRPSDGVAPKDGNPRDRRSRDQAEVNPLVMTDPLANRYYSDKSYARRGLHGAGQEQNMNQIGELWEHRAKNRDRDQTRASVMTGENSRTNHVAGAPSSSHRRSKRDIRALSDIMAAVSRAESQLDAKLDELQTIKVEFRRIHNAVTEAQRDYSDMGSSFGSLASDAIGATPNAFSVGQPTKAAPYGDVIRSSPSANLLSKLPQSRPARKLEFD
eukprot:c46237_g1_i1.p1 GENE.c46237_g1_i1~~c46237_g1_i1.p1  ORF type:complete len:532 (-),score=63.46 c46237_g1_i1:65-1660(-)